MHMPMSYRSKFFNAMGKAIFLGGGVSNVTHVLVFLQWSFTRL
jgi:hypothetical protein